MDLLGIGEPPLKRVIEPGLKRINPQTDQAVPRAKRDKLDRANLAPGLFPNRRLLLLGLLLDSRLFLLSQVFIIAI